jgi:hypothetical protein
VRIGSTKWTNNSNGIPNEFPAHRLLRMQKQSPSVSTIEILYESAGVDSPADVTSA